MVDLDSPVRHHFFANRIRTFHHFAVDIRVPLMQVLVKNGEIKVHCSVNFIVYKIYPRFRSVTWARNKTAKLTSPPQGTSPTNSE
jgi:hypothetical protein